MKLVKNLPFVIFVLCCCIVEVDYVSDGGVRTLESYWVHLHVIGGTPVQPTISKSFLALYSENQVKDGMAFCKRRPKERHGPGSTGSEEFWLTGPAANTYGNQAEDSGTM